MTIQVNGEPYAIDEEKVSVMQLLARLKISPSRVAVEYNLKILPKADYEATWLKDKDQLEIVHFVGGG